MGVGERREERSGRSKRSEAGGGMMRKEEDEKGRNEGRKSKNHHYKGEENCHHSIFHTNTHSSYLETTHGVKKQDLQERLQDGAKLARDPVHDLRA